jgi:hypothetical protein
MCPVSYVRQTTNGARPMERLLPQIHKNAQTYQPTRSECYLAPSVLAVLLPKLHMTSCQRSQATGLLQVGLSQLSVRVERTRPSTRYAT